MNSSDPLKRHHARKIIGIFLAVIAFGFLIASGLKNPEQTASLFLESNKILILVILGFQVVSFGINAFISRQLLKFTGNKTSFSNNIQIAVANEFGNWVMPIAGGSITSYFVYKRIGIPTSVILFLETAGVLLNSFQYVVFFFLSVLILPFSVISLIPRIGLYVIAAAIVVIVGGWYFFSGKERLGQLKKLVFRIIRVIKKISPFKLNEQILSEKIEHGSATITDNFSYFFSKPRSTALIFFCSSMYFATDILMLNLSFQAFGFHTSLALTTFGLILSLLLSVLTLFPGSPGVTETSLILVFKTFGVPYHVALLSVFLFRLLSYWMWIPLSIYITFAGKKGEVQSQPENIPIQ